MILDLVQDAPNPQFMREQMTDLTGEWEFSYDDANVGLTERWSDTHHGLVRRIKVPYPPESRLSGIHDTSFHKILWYRRTFQDPRQNPNDHLLLKFGAVDYRCTVWVNGQYVGNHEGGSTPFEMDITAALTGNDGIHVVTVRVEDDPEDMEQPRGKQDWIETPRKIHYHRTSGIWQPVWLEVAPSVRIENIVWSFNQEKWTVSYEAALSHIPAPGSMFSTELEFEDKTIALAVNSVQGRMVHGTLDVSRGIMSGDRRLLLWSPKTPNLIAARLTLTAPERPQDVVLSYLGLRTVSTEGRHVTINGSRTFLRMVLNQGYWPESHLAAPSPSALKREVELILELGFNGARNHQKVEDPRFLFWADKLGLLLWGEMGSAFAYSDRGIERHAKEWREVVQRDRNHPSIITWVPFNESWGIDDVAVSERQQHAVSEAYHATHQLDGTRPVIGNDGWENVEGDIFTIHDYTWNPELLEKNYGSESSPEMMVAGYDLEHRRLIIGGFEFNGKPIILSEYGGVSFAPVTDESWFGYGRVSTREEFLQTYRELTEVVSSSTQLAGFCYTQLTDTGQETNGLLTADRTPKADIDALRKINIGQHVGRIRPTWQ